MGFAQVSRTCFGRALHALLHLDDHYGVVNVEVPRSAPIDLTPVTTSQPSPPDPDETPSPAPLTPTSPPANNDTVWWIIILSLFLLFLLVVLVFICCIVRLRNENKKLQKTKSLQPTRNIEMTPQSPNSRGLSRSLPPSPMPLTSSDFDAKGLPPNFNDSANGLTAYTDSVNGLRETAGDSGLNPSNAPPSSAHSSLAGAAGATSLATSQTQSRPFTSTPMHLAADSASEVETSGLPSEQHFSTESLPPLNIAPVQTQGLVVNNQVVVTPRSTRNLHRQSLSDLDMQSVPQNYQMRPAVATPRSSRNLLAAQNGVPVTPISRNPRRPPIQVDDSLSSASPGVGLQPTTPSNRGLRRLLVQPDDVPGSVLGINQSFTPNNQSFTPSSQPFTPSNRGLRRLVIPDDGSNSTPFPATPCSRGLRRLVVSAERAGDHAHQPRDPPPVRCQRGWDAFDSGAAAHDAEWSESEAGAVPAGGAASAGPLSESSQLCVRRCAERRPGRRGWRAAGQRCSGAWVGAVGRRSETVECFIVVSGQRDEFIE